MKRLLIPSIMILMTLTVIPNAHSQQMESNPSLEVNDDIFLTTQGMKSYTVTVNDRDFVVYYDTLSAETNNETTLTSIALNEQDKSLIINTSGVIMDDHVEILIPDELISAEGHNFRILVNGQQVNYELDHYSNHSMLGIMIPEGTDRIEIIGTYVVPEFASFTVIVLVISIASIIGLSFKRRLGYTY